MLLFLILHFFTLNGNKKYDRQMLIVCVLAIKFGDAKHSEYAYFQEEKPGQKPADGRRNWTAEGSPTRRVQSGTR